MKIDHSKCHCPDIEARARSMPCEEVKCYSACGGKALSIAIDLEPIIYEDLCDGCGKCVEACPCGAIKEEENGSESRT